ncbi:MAG: hypothetical protein ABW352_24920 [Polyangiales bacterium]
MGAVGCGDDDGNDDQNNNRPDGSVDAAIDSGNTLLDANLDATSADAAVPLTPQQNVSSKAADLAVTINLLLGEHLIIAAKTTGAALRGEPAKPEYDAYAALLNQNGLDLGELVGQAFGDAAKTTFNGIWSAHNGFFVEYTVGVATNDEAKKTQAVNDLTTKYVPQFSGLVSTATGLPVTAITPLVTEHVTGTKAIVDAQGAKNYTAEYAATRAAFAHMAMLGNPLAQGVAKQKPADFPGDAASKAALFRVALNQALQEHLYLASFATGAAINGRTDEFTAAGAALNTNGTDIGKALNPLYGAAAETQFNSIWSAHNGFFVEYTQAAAAGNAEGKTAAVGKLTGMYVPQFSALLEVATGTPAAQWSPEVGMHVTHTAEVVDAQVALKASNTPANATTVVSKDRIAGQHMQKLGDALSKGIVGKLPGSF